MTLQEQIRKDMLNAMKTRNQDVLDLLRVVAGEFGREMKSGKQLSDGEAIKVLKKMSENAKELDNLQEVQILSKYLPEMVEQSEILAIITKIIIDNRITDVKQMGEVMGLLKQHPKAALIDNKFASAAIRLQLTKEN